jgi:hypothetical protein
MMDTPYSSDSSNSVLKFFPYNLRAQPDGIISGMLRWIKTLKRVQELKKVVQAFSS